MRILLLGLFLLVSCGKAPTPTPPEKVDSFVVDAPGIHIEGKLKPGAKVSAEHAKMMLQYAVSGAK